MFYIFYITNFNSTLLIIYPLILLFILECDLNLPFQYLNVTSFFIITIFITIVYLEVYRFVDFFLYFSVVIGDFNKVDIV